jgi:5-methylcytosine-specific restriction endonuclease McrA
MRDYNNDLQYKKWRSDVYKRDNFTCQWPGCSLKKRLNAHHIKTWAHYPGLRYILANGITLCYKHHKMIQGMEELYEISFLRILANKK